MEFRITVLVGSLAVVAIALSPLYARRLRVSRSPRAGSLLVVGAVAVATWAAAIDWASARDEIFLAVFAVLFLGALLILGDDPDDRPPDEAGEEPPWWPEFEADFGRYVRHRRRLSRR